MILLFPFLSYPSDYYASPLVPLLTSVALFFYSTRLILFFPLENKVNLRDKIASDLLRTSSKLMACTILYSQQHNNIQLVICYVWHSM